MNNSGFGVALVHTVCPVCLEKDEGMIIMNNRKSKKRAQEIEDAHGKAIGFSDKPCKKCQEKLEDHVALIIVDREKTTDEKDPYRIGMTVMVPKEAVKQVPPNNIAYLYQDEALLLGIINNEDLEKVKHAKKQ